MDASGKRKRLIDQGGRKDKKRAEEGTYVVLLIVMYHSAELLRHVGSIEFVAQFPVVVSGANAWKYRGRKRINTTHVCFEYISFMQVWM